MIKDDCFGDHPMLTNTLFAMPTAIQSSSKSASWSLSQFIIIHLQCQIKLFRKPPSSSSPWDHDAYHHHHFHDDHHHLVSEVDIFMSESCGLPRVRGRLSAPKQLRQNISPFSKEYFSPFSKEYFLPFSKDYFSPFHSSNFALLLSLGLFIRNT